MQWLLRGVYNSQLKCSERETPNVIRVKVLLVVCITYRKEDLADQMEYTMFLQLQVRLLSGLSHPSRLPV
jgi:hypothetical protein